MFWATVSAVFCLAVSDICHTYVRTYSFVCALLIEFANLLIELACLYLNYDDDDDDYDWRGPRPVRTGGADIEAVVHLQHECFVGDFESRLFVVVVVLLHLCAKRRHEVIVRVVNQQPCVSTQYIQKPTIIWLRALNPCKFVSGSARENIVWLSIKQRY